MRRGYRIHIREDVGLNQISECLGNKGSRISAPGCQDKKFRFGRVAVVSTLTSVGDDVTHMFQLSQDVRFLELASDVVLGVPPTDLVQVDQLADQLLPGFNVIGETYDSLCSLTETMIRYPILTGKQLVIV